MSFFSKYLVLPTFAAIVFAPSVASAISYDNGRFGLRLTGYGTAGILEPDFETPDFVGDWRVRGEMDYLVTDGNKLGLVYAIDAAAVDEDKFFR